MSTDGNINFSNPQLLSAVNDPLTGQTLAPVSKQQVVSSTPSFSQVLAEKQEAINNANAATGATQQLVSMMDVDIRKLRLDIAGEIKTHVMAGDREALKDAQERYNQCTVELRKRAGILEGTAAIVPLGVNTTIPIGTPPATSLPVTSTVPLNAAVPLGTSTVIPPGTTATIPLNTSGTNAAIPLNLPNATSVPQPSTENVFPDGNPLQLLYQSPYANQPALYQNQPTGASSFSNSSGLITPDQLKDSQILVNPLYNQDLNQMQQWNAQQLQMLQLQLQQGMSGFGGDQQNNSLSF